VLAWYATQGSIYVPMNSLGETTLTASSASLTLQAMNACERWFRYEEPIEFRSSRHLLVSDPDSPELHELVDRVLERLRSVDEGAVVSILFAEVALTASCLAVVLTPVLLAIHRGEIRNRYFRVIDNTGRNEWDADAALRKQSARLMTKLACVWRSDTGSLCEVVGPVDEQVAATYRFVFERCAIAGGARTRDLAEAENITIQAASNRFAKAATQGLLHRAETVSVPGGGVQHLYVAVV
jgi:hypothetical protein